MLTPSVTANVVIDDTRSTFKRSKTALRLSSACADNLRTCTGKLRPVPFLSRNSIECHDAIARRPNSPCHLCVRTANPRFLEIEVSSEWREANLLSYRLSTPHATKSTPDMRTYGFTATTVRCRWSLGTVNTSTNPICPSNFSTSSR